MLNIFQGRFRFEGESFPTVQELIVYQHQSMQPVTRKSEAMLKKPILRADWELKNDDIELHQKIGSVSILSSRVVCWSARELESRRWAWCHCHSQSCYVVNARDALVALVIGNVIIQSLYLMVVVIALPCLSAELNCVADVDSRWQLQSANMVTLFILHTKFSTIVTLLEQFTTRVTLSPLPSAFRKSFMNRLLTLSQTANELWCIFSASRRAFHGIRTYSPMFEWASVTERFMKLLY